MALLGGTGAMLAGDWVLGRPPSPIMIAVLVWCGITAIALLLVVPAFVVWPTLRAPSYAVAAGWGAVATTVGVVLLEPDTAAAVRKVPQLIEYALAGAVGGLSYVAAMTFDE
jgi:hypothetical protein